MKSLDLIGQKFGRLLVIQLWGKTSHSSGYYQKTWECLCDCGNKKIVPQGYLTSNETRSCGCLRRKILGTAPFNKLYSKYQKEAKDRKYEWTLTKEEFKKLTKQNCHYCGIHPYQIIKAFSKTTKKEWVDTNVYIYNGVDRTDNTKGYILENCVPCCKPCNQAKSNYTYENFKKLIVCIYQNWASK